MHPLADPTPVGRRPGLPTCLGVGVLAAVLGLLPWLVTGMRLPLQNLWANSTTDMPVGLLPFSQYAVTLTFSLVVVGYGIAGVVVRALGARRAAWVAALGVLAVHTVATVQTARVVWSGLQQDREGALYLAANLAVVLVAVVVGLLVLVLVTVRGRAWAVIGFSAFAVVLGGWLAALVFPFGSLPGDGPVRVAVEVQRWGPAVLVGLGIAWGGVRSAARIAAAAVGLLLLWTVPAVFTAVGYTAGSRAMLRYPAEMLDAGRQVLHAALTMPEVVVPPLLLAVFVAAVGVVGEVVVRSLTAGRRTALR